MTIRIPAGLKKAIEEAAAEESRTVNSYAIHVLRRAVGARYVHVPRKRKAAAR